MVSFPKDFNTVSYKVVNGELSVCSKWDVLIRFFIPPVRTESDNKIAHFFQKHIQNSLSSNGTSDNLALYASASSFLSKWTVSSRPPKSVAGLEALLYVMKQRLHLREEIGISSTELKERIKAHQAKECHKWIAEYGFSEDVYLNYPDFVDFFVKSHLHRHFKIYEHSMVCQDGEPCIKVEGQLRPWSYIKNKFVIENGLLYQSHGDKKRWVYLQNGLEQYDPIHWDEPKPFKKLPEKPGQYQFQLVTAHVNSDHWQFFDSVAKGARHSWFRLITAEGEVYSFGRRPSKSEFSFAQPFEGTSGFIETPDIYEFCSERQLVTTIPVTEEAAHRIFETVKKHRQTPVFNSLVFNCCSFTLDVLKAAGVEDIPNCGRHPVDIIGKFFIPKLIRKPIIFLWKHTFGLVIPHQLREWGSKVRNVLFSLVAFPVFLLLGAWKNKAKNRVGGGDENLGTVFRGWRDILDPHRLEINMPDAVAKWQKKQDNTQVN